MREIFKIKTFPKACSKNIIQGDRYRITILTDGLIRLEYREDGQFEDRASQMVYHRNFAPSDFRVTKSGNGMEIHTKRVHLIYNEKEFSSHGLSIQVIGNLSAYHSIWRYSEEIHDLKGTARTLDEVDGAVELDRGLISRFGYSVLDDSKSMLLTEDGWVEPRLSEGQDLYFFGYGHDYLECLKDFTYLCGKTPMLPRYALGNWWSRYYQYTEDSYLELMDRFEEENLPFTVAVIDMDWHLVDIDPKYGNGWTGYTWNRKLFPDPAGFLRKLHDRGMRTTLNVHPAAGIRAHEEMYEEMAKELEIDYEMEDPINFDISNPVFLESYLKHAHHPNEDIGVDFWWLDWQQGGNSKIPGLDPLWMLNHYHFLDSGRDGKRPMTFSRYAGPGSHRYPVGFSGDSITTWESLDFQPYFTANASNINYGWWSHDIGGHMMGYKNDEMVARWVQFGVFSPIMRLHSSCSIFNGKEPWRFQQETEQVMGEYLRLRHRLMPYLYTMNYLAYHEDIPMIMPMYYKNPEEKKAYQVPNQYYFGSGLVVAPITSKRLARYHAAKVSAWIPDGIYIDLFSHMVYKGGRSLDLYRSLDHIPVLAKAGTILPLTDRIKADQVAKNPKDLHIMIFPGDNGTFTLYEDDNETCSYQQGNCVTTKMELNWEGAQSFFLYPAKGDTSLIPEKRDYILEFPACTEGDCTVTCDGKRVIASKSYDTDSRTYMVKIPDVPVSALLVVEFHRVMELIKNPVLKLVFNILNEAEIDFMLKEELYHMVEAQTDLSVLLAEIQVMDIDLDLKGILFEILTA